MKLSIKGGLSVNSVFEKGYRPFHISVISKDLQAIKVLVENGAKIKLKDNEDHTPLELCLKLGTKDTSILFLIAKYLLKIQNSKKKLKEV